MAHVSTAAELWLNFPMRPPASRTGTETMAGPDWQIVATRADFEALEPEWDTLAAQSAMAGQTFLSFNWHWHWVNHYFEPARDRFAILVGRRQGKAVTIWPLVLRRKLGLAFVSFMGVPVSQYGGVLADRKNPQLDADLAAGFDLIRRTLGADVLRLSKVRDDSPIAPLLARLGTARENAQTAPYIALAGHADFASLDQTYASKGRKNRRRKRRRLDEAGLVTFRHVQGTEAIAAAVRLAVARKRDWLAACGILTSAVYEPSFEAFFIDAAAHPVRKAGVDVFEMLLDGAPMSTLVTVGDGVSRALHLSSYDPAAEHLSPGMLSFEPLLADSIGARLKAFDFMAPAAPYKLDWATGTTGIADYVVPMGAFGHAYHTAYLKTLRPRLKAIAQHGPMPVRRLVGSVAKVLGRPTNLPVDRSSDDDR